MNIRPSSGIGVWPILIRQVKLHSIILIYTRAPVTRSGTAPSATYRCTTSRGLREDIQLDDPQLPTLQEAVRLQIRPRPRTQANGTALETRVVVTRTARSQVHHGGLAREA